MCGIVGVVGGVPDRAGLERACGLMTHRGPDGGGVWTGEGAALGARRLAVIDPDAGHQPVANEDGSVVAVHNGEIVNAAEMRRGLEADGHRFRSHTDSEVLVHGWEAWGTEVVGRLRGMFAFAIWDDRRNRGVVARDRFGIKPLLWAEIDGRVGFASELGALLAALPELPRRIDPEAISRILSLGFLPGPAMPLAGVRELPPGHLLELGDGSPRPRRYWRLEAPPAGEHLRLSRSDARDRFAGRLAETIRAWKVSDVGLAALLSGGVDSATLAALLAAGDDVLDTFTIGFAEPARDERPEAQRAATHIASRHRELVFDDAAFDALPAIVRAAGRPLSSATSVPLAALYRACRDQGHRVVVTGEGADELLGGYGWFRGDRLARPLLRLPRVLRTALAAAPGPVSEGARRVVASGAADPLRRWTLWHSTARPAAARRLLREATPEREWWDDDLTELVAGRHPQDQLQAAEVAARLPALVNLEVDAASMIASVEARPPLLDHLLWEETVLLAPSLRRDKRLLRDVARSLLPPATAGRRKLGLAAPHAAWWRRTRLPDWAEERLLPASLDTTGLLNPEAVADLRREHRSGRDDHARLLTCVLTTQIWCEEFLG